MRRLLVLVFFIILAARAVAQETIAGEAGKSLDDAIRRATWGQFWGAVMVQRNGELLLCKGYGIARRETLAPVTGDSLFDLASVSKAFTGAAILRLEIAGKLTTEDPISKHLPGVPDDKQNITIHHLLTHTSGIGEGSIPQNDDRDVVVAAILRSKSERAPGEAHEYSNAGYFLLAAIVEHASGKKHDDFVRDEVLRGAGMTVGGWEGDASLPAAFDTDRIDSDRSSGGLRVVGSATRCPYPMTWGYRGSGGIVTSARQMFAWDRALRGEGLLDEARRAKMFTPLLENYAYGWEVREGAGGRVASHSGGVAGYRVWLTRWLDRDACVFVVTNGQHDVKGVHDALVAALFPDEAPRLRAVFRPGLYKIGEHGMVRGPDEISIGAMARGKDVIVRVKEPGRDESLVELEMSAANAIDLAGQIRKALGKPAAKAVSASPLVDATIYSRPYEIKDGVFEVSGDGLVLQATPGTPHADADANLRISIVLMDMPRRFWPMILKIDRGAAATLADEIEGAAKAK